MHESAPKALFKIDSLALPHQHCGRREIRTEASKLSLSTDCYIREKNFPRVFPFL